MPISLCHTYALYRVPSSWRYVHDHELFNHIAAEFRMSIPPPLSTSTPARSEEFQSQTVVGVGVAETRRVQVGTSTSQGRVTAYTQPILGPTNHQRVPLTVSATTRSDPRNDRGADDQLSDYEDLFSPPTTFGHLSPPPQASPTRSQTMPQLSGRPPPSGLQPAKQRAPGRRYAETSGSAVRRPSPTVFRFDEPRLPSTQRHEADADVDETRPSPIYAEPCDRLADGLRHRVAVRRVRGPSTTVATPRISAGYKLPRDFLSFAAERSAASSGDPPRDGRSPQVVVTPPSTVDDDDVAAASTLDPGGAGEAQTRARGDGDRLKVRAAAVRRQRRSSYANVNGEEDMSDEDHRSRRTTVSSGRTEYSPPWDADRWRFLVEVSDKRQFCDCETPRTATSEQPIDQVDVPVVPDFEQT